MIPEFTPARDWRIQAAKELLHAEGYVVVKRDRLEILTSKAIISPLVPRDGQHTTSVLQNMARHIGVIALEKGALHRHDEDVGDLHTGLERLLLLRATFIKPKETECPSTEATT